MEGKIVVLAGSYAQFKDWLEHNVVPITSKMDMEKIHGTTVSQVFTEGDYYKWFDDECANNLRYHMVPVVEGKHKAKSGLD